MRWMVLPLLRYAEFHGRSRRMEFWMFMLLYALVLTAGFALIIGGGITGSSGDLNLLSAVGLALIIGWWLGTFVPCVAVSVRRLHDRDMPGAVYLVFVIGWFVPFVGLITFIAYAVVMLLEGTPGENRYGPDPKGRGLVDVFA